jgi:glycosyltransferase involved in cell wall biosynthesis
MQHKYKICVYAICKNEEQFVDRWMDHVKEADLVIVTDTGSSDNTIEKLKQRGAVVDSFITDTFRFDYSRNYCLDLIPKDIDICVSLDLDDVIELGWREKLESAWGHNTTRGLYLYNWSFNDDGTPSVQYTHQRIHARKKFHWIYPTHEVLEYLGIEKERQQFVKGLVVNHFPDRKKDRSFNLSLLELAVEEYPNNSRNLHYLGREYMYFEKWDKCIETLLKYLDPQISFWDEERSASMRFIAKSYGELGNKVEQKKWLYKAMAETPFLREPYMELASIAYDEKNWEALLYYSKEALKIKNKTYNYVNETFAWNYTPYDYVALAYYNLGIVKEAIPYSLEAMKLEPENERLKTNHRFYEQEQL